MFHSSASRSVARHERRLPAHRQADIAGGEVGVDRAAAVENRLPLRVGIGLGDARRFEIRRTDISWRKSTSQGSTPPDTGAALIGSGVQASGMCPSPASSPDVGSRPIQPPPGRYTSHQAWRSVKSRSTPVGPSIAFTSGRQLDQIAGHEARGEPEVAEELHEQPRRVSAGARCQLERTFHALHAGVEADDVGDVLLQAGG